MLGLWENVFTVSEYIISPECRGQGVGSSALAELLKEACLNQSIRTEMRGTISIKDKVFELPWGYNLFVSPWQLFMYLFIYLSLSKNAAQKIAGEFQ